MRVGLASVALLGGALLLYLPFFATYVNVGASGIGWVEAGDNVGLWLLIWGGLGFMVASWLLWTVHNAGVPRRIIIHVGQSPETKDPVMKEYVTEEYIDEDISLLDTPVVTSHATDHTPALEPDLFWPRSGVARLMGIGMRHFERLPRFWYLHRLLVQFPTLGYLLGIAAVPMLLAIAIGAWLLGRDVLALCLALLAVGLPLLWRRASEADSADHLATMLALTGVAILAGTQVFYLKDFLQGSPAYRMNTVFKFFNQVWVLWGIAAAIALPRLWSELWNFIRQIKPVYQYPVGESISDQVDAEEARGDGLPNVWRPPVVKRIGRSNRGWRIVWRLACVVLLAASSVYLVFGTPARLSQRFVGWVPSLGTLDGLAFMQQGRYSWPDESNWIDLSYDSAAIQWLLEHVRGNLVIVESADVDYYRAGGTRVASMTGLSGLRGAHVAEQRYAEQVGARDGLHREFWSTPSLERTEELIAQLQISLIYVGQLEQYVHPEGAQKLARMAIEGRLDVLYENEGVIIYAVPGRLAAHDGGWLARVPEPLSLPDVGTQAPARLDTPVRS
jgi:uncharacterized membrane protein